MQFMLGKYLQIYDGYQCMYMFIITKTFKNRTLALKILTMARYKIFPINFLNWKLCLCFS